MVMPRSRGTACVYCGAEPADSKDHIIPGCLGGSRKVPSCGRHNHVFGHTFEACAAQQLLAWSVLLYSWGVPMRPMRRWYERALTIGDRVVDLRVGKQGIEYRLHRPVLRLDDAGVCNEAYFTTAADERRFLAAMQRRHPEDAWVPTEERMTANLADLQPPLELGMAVHQLALKMTIAAASLLPHTRVIDVVSRVGFLDGHLPMPSPVTAHYFVTLPAVQEWCAPLSHTLYVEHVGNALVGVVSLYGVFQVYVTLNGMTSAPGAEGILLSVDPVSGNRQQRYVAPVGVVPPPAAYASATLLDGIANWGRRIVESALARGATRTPVLGMTVCLDQQATTGAIRSRQT
jgi:hypothetical protein